MVQSSQIRSINSSFISDLFIQSSKTLFTLNISDSIIFDQAIYHISISVCAVKCWSEVKNISVFAKYVYERIFAVPNPLLRLCSLEIKIQIVTNWEKYYKSTMFPTCADIYFVIWQLTSNEKKSFFLILWFQWMCPVYFYFH